jgi:glycosyltransferase involved in cell wall biosynthesis
MHTTFATATRILVTSTDSLRCVPKRYRDKCDIQLGIGSDVTHSVDAPSGVSSIKLLFAGRLVYWKGVHLALSAFKQVLETIPDAQLTIVGSGPDECWLKDMATSLCVNHAVEWRPWVQRDELIGLYQGHTALLFPSLHDSGGMVVLEALSNGLPVVCLDLGGPGVMVDDSCGVKVDASCSQSIVVKELADAVLSIALNPKKRNELSSGSIARASTFEWTTVAEKLYGTSSASHSGTPLGQRPLTAVY